MSNVEAKSSPYEVAERAIKILVALLGVCYALGLLVSNQYLIGLGVSDFSSVRPKYIFTGLWTLLLLLFATAPVFWSSVALISLKNTGFSAYRRIGFIVTMGILVGGVTSAVSFAGLLYLLQFDVSSKTLGRGHLIESLVFLEIVCSVIACIARFFALNSKTETKPAFMLYSYYLSLLILCFGAALSTHIIATRMYGQIPPGLGGGAPVYGQVLLNDKGERLWKKYSSTQGDLKDRISTIMYEDDKIMVIIVNNPRLPNGVVFGSPVTPPMILNKDLVDAIVLYKDRLIY
jgi:hypothetical protein